jgi:predicted aldo/keto reductase-like oxidoreductase
MIKNTINKEKFQEEFDRYISKGVDPIDAVMTIGKTYGLTEEQIPKLLSDSVMHLLRLDAARLNYIKHEESASIDDFF